MVKIVHKPRKPEAAPRALSIEEVTARTGLGRTTLYRVINRGELVARKAGRRTVFLEADVERYLATLPRLALPRPALLHKA